MPKPGQVDNLARCQNSLLMCHTPLWQHWPVWTQQFTCIIWCQVEPSHHQTLQNKTDHSKLMAMIWILSAMIRNLKASNNDRTSINQLSSFFTDVHLTSISCLCPLPVLGYSAIEPAGRRPEYISTQAVRCIQPTLGSHDLRGFWWPGSTSTRTNNKYGCHVTFIKGHLMDLIHWYPCTMCEVLSVCIMQCPGEVTHVPYQSMNKHPGAVIKDRLHWNGDVVILMKFSSLSAPEVVMTTTSGAGSDENFIKMMTFPIQWITVYQL